MVEQYMAYQRSSNLFGAVKNFAKQCQVMAAPVQFQIAFPPDPKLQKTLSPSLAISKNIADYLDQTELSKLGPQNRFHSEICLGEKSSPHEIAVTYYDLMGRIATGQEAYAAQVAAIGRMLGESKSQDLSWCQVSNFPNIRRICDGAKNCSVAPDSLDQLVQEQLAVAPEIDEIQRGINFLSGKLDGAPKPLRGPLKQEIRELEAQKQKLEARIPWSLGSLFQAHANRNDPAVLRDAIREQLDSDRKKAILNFQILQRDKNCLTGEVTSNPAIFTGCSVQNLKKITELSPGPILLEKPDAASSVPAKKQKIMARSLMQNADCKVIEKQFQEGFTSELESGLAQAGVAILTAGLNELPILEQFLMRKAYFSPATTGKIIKTLEVGDVALDIWQTASGVASNDPCVPKDVIPTATALPNQCPVPAIYENSKESVSYRECVMSTAMTLLNVGGLAFGEAHLGDVLAQQSTTLHALETVPTLTQKQTAGLYKVHMIGHGEPGLEGHPAGIGFYTYDQLKRKVEAMDALGISVSDRRKLIEAGVVGDTMDLSRFNDLVESNRFDERSIKKSKARRICQDDDCDTESDDTFYIPKAKSENGKVKFKSADALNRENEQVWSICTELKLTRSQQRVLHDEITGQGLSREAIKERARDLFFH